MNAAGVSLFRRMVEENRRFVLTTHMNPDGDAIGSEMGLGRVLLGLGREIRVINQDAVPENLLYLVSPPARVEVYDPADHDAALAAADVLVLLDNSAPDRLGRMEGPVRALASKTLCIDHHPARETLWAHNILHERACATSAIVYELADGIGAALDPQAAEALYAGLATDTGFFRFNSTTSRAHEIAAALLKAGADPARAYREVYERNSSCYTRLLGQALAAHRLDADGRLVSVKLTRAMEEACGGGDVDTSEMTTPLLAMDGARIVLLFRELPDGRVKVSLRSKGTIDVYRLASEFGGGGHRNASGIVTSGALDEVAERVIARARESLGKAPAADAAR